MFKKIVDHIGKYTIFEYIKETNNSVYCESVLIFKCHGCGRFNSPEKIFAMEIELPRQCKNTKCKFSTYNAWR